MTVESVCRMDFDETVIYDYSSVSFFFIYVSTKTTEVSVMKIQTNYIWI